MLRGDAATAAARYYVVSLCRAIDPNPHAPALTPKGVSVCAPAPTPHLGRASAAAALPWRPQRAASSS
ncbi:hypothetical protein T492DRAFT_1000948 [Pavlovales sp. CCMP2436]|nr:hypothetical protein T492DRAFT_1000948 [Pavlovales sp. CCMP2436]